MEELLKAYAEKRRKDAGAPFDMHPATRRLLQGEVARRWAKDQRQSPSFLQLLINFWPRLAFAISAVLLLGVVVWLSTPDSRRKSRTQMAQNAKKPAAEPLAADKYEERLADKDSESAADRHKLTLAERDNAAAPSAPSATPPASSAARAQAEAKAPAVDPFLLSQTEERKETSSLAAGASRAPAIGGGIAGEDPRGYSFFSQAPADTNSPGLLGAKRAPQSAASGGLAPDNNSLANGAKLTLNSPAAQARAKDGPALLRARGIDEGQLTLGRSAATQATAGATALAYSSEQERLLRKSDAPVNAPAVAAAGKELDGLAARTDAAELPGGARVHFRELSEKPQSAAKPVLLSSFDVEQNGDRIRIYDADGSVYDGRVTSAADKTARMAGPSGTTETATRELKATEKTPAPTTLALAPEPSPQKLLFQASGTNRNLKQLVVINGTLIAAADAKAKAEANVSLAQQTQEGLRREAARGFGSAPAQPSAPTFRSRAVAPDSSTTATVLSDMAEKRQDASPARIVRLQGRANIGGTNFLEIDAVRAGR